MIEQLMGFKFCPEGQRIVSIIIIGENIAIVVTDERIYKVEMVDAPWKYEVRLVGVWR